MRFAPEIDYHDNRGLELAREILLPVQAAHPEISVSDLWILASYVGLEMTGGPIIPFTPGPAPELALLEFRFEGRVFNRVDSAGREASEQGEPLAEVLNEEGVWVSSGLEHLLHVHAVDLRERRDARDALAVASRGRRRARRRRARRRRACRGRACAREAARRSCCGARRASRP